MKAAVYVLGFLTSLVCAALLLRAYFGSRNRLLLWSGLCFVGLTASNLLVFLDIVTFPDVDLYPYRLITAAAGMLLLLFGLIWETE